jgi:predicted ester cyclase
MPESKYADQNKFIYRRYIEEIFNEGRLEKLNEFVPPDYVLHDAPHGMPSGPEVIKYIVAMFRGAFPDLKITLDDLIVEGDLVAARSTLRGTHRGMIFGIPATGRAVTMPGLTMVRISGGRVCESWVRNDVMGLMSQLRSESV